MKNNKDKDVEQLEMILNPTKSHKNKIIGWLYWKVYFRVWFVWRLELMALWYKILLKIHKYAKNKTT